MERRFVARLEELLDDAIVRPAILRALVPLLERFVEPCFITGNRVLAWQQNGFSQ